MNPSPDSPGTTTQENADLHYGSSHGHSEYLTGTHSGTESPLSLKNGKKHVNWVLPAAEKKRNDDVGASSPEIPDRYETIEENGNTDSPEARTRKESASSQNLERHITNEELRNQIHQIFSQHNSRTPSEASDDRQEANPPEPLRGRGQPAKSVLRKGHITPGGSPSRSPPATEQRRRERERKTTAAAHARRKAHWWSRSVDTSPEPPSDRPRGRSRTQPTLYHEGTVFDSHNSGTTTPDIYTPDYIPKPERYRVSGLSAMGLLDMFHMSRHSSIDNTDDSENSTPGFKPKSLPGSRRGSPRGSHAGIGDLIQSSSVLGGHGYSDIGKARRPETPRTHSTDSRYSTNHAIKTLGGKIHMPWKANKDEEIRIKNHIQQTVSRHRYLIKLCHALMMYGAPTHRLEQYMKMSARVLETEAQFLYIPGCMIVSFDDSRTHTAEVKLVRNSQGIDLGKISDTHDVYKDVVHDLIGVEEALERLDEILNRKEKFNKWFRVLVYGLASVGVGPFAFSARLIDLPIAFLLGCILGFLQLIVATKAELYSNVFEIMAVMITSFLARAFGSINHDGKRLFCFSALAQSAIALILPGYIVLCGSLELQSRSIVAGSVRLVYAIIYSLFIGYGLTLGTAIYGAIDTNATSETVCKNPLSDDGYWFFFFVILFAICLMIINQAKWKQMPMMTLIAFTGYIVSYFSSHQFIGNSQVTSTLAALTIGIMANLYSRIGMRVDSLLNKPAKWIKSKYHTLTKKLSLQSREQLTLTPSSSPSTLEKQTGNGDVSATSSSILHKITRSFTHASQNSKPTSAVQNNNGDSHSERKNKENDKPKNQQRANYSLASAAMLPAIFVLVPSGLSVSGSLVSGIEQADKLVHNTKNTGGVATASQVTTGNLGNGLAFNVGYSVVQIAIGITVGLLFGTLVVYPFGKGGKLGKGRGMRSGLFSF